MLLKKGAFYLEYLKRHSANLSNEWNVSDYKRNEPKLPEYEKRKLEVEKRLENITNNFVEYFWRKEKELKVLATYLILLLMVHFY